MSNITTVRELIDLVYPKIKALSEKNNKISLDNIKKYVSKCNPDKLEKLSDLSTTIERQVKDGIDTLKRSKTMDFNYFSNKKYTQYQVLEETDRSNAMALKSSLESYSKILNSMTLIDETPVFGTLDTSELNQHLGLPPSNKSNNGGTQP